MARTYKYLISFVILSALVIFYALPAFACTINGQKVPVGTRVGSLVCLPDGTWAPSGG